ncbi:MAG: adenylate/guanylate cyclase domain-containing protein [Myxococcales bacterium]|nr:adenylate/guanylate cyclase domain-containing protein [Myxococcales bacterium]
MHRVSDTAGTQAVVPREGSITALPVAGFLTVVEGPTALLGRRFALRDREISVGRAPDCYVAIPDPSVSRYHATLHQDEEGLSVAHRSQTNPTYLNGAPVEEPARVFDGDQIQLADRVVLRLEAPSFRRDEPANPRSLAGAMEARVELDESIAAQYVRAGSFLDVDVYDSYGLKCAEERAERVVVSFARFRAFIERSVDESRGVVLNSNGDEVMAFFESADDAVLCARAILTTLPAFNEAENLLPRPFEVRTGIHSGTSAVDLERGLAFSPVLDGAGHLQKEAAVGGLLISDATYDALTTKRDLFVSAGPLEKDGIRTFALREA